MTFRGTVSLVLLVLFISLAPIPASSTAPPARPSPASFRVPNLLYHRFGPTVADWMTITTPVFESHLKYLRDNGYRVIPLRRLTDFYLGKAPAPPPKSVVITADDGHRSVYSQMLPLVRKYNVPVTLFIYPSAISNASYAMTWEQLRELKKTGLFDIQSHTYWHPNFIKERKRLKPAEYAKFVDMQLGKSKARLEKELGGRVDMLSWPFGGIPERFLEDRASAAGYVAAFTIVRRVATPSEDPMKLPRFLMVDSARGKAFEAILRGSSGQ
ncbi:MAG: polysaccharide deacetylase family protein [Deltaproteobacteria bacterium]|nr:polysaccharide deacetylase family protein [Deltaproteobacteria bacterium]